LEGIFKNSVMKKSILLLTILFLGVKVSFAQEQHHHEKAEYDKLDGQLELLMDTAAKHMIMFILTQKEDEYNTSQATIKQADTLYQSIVKLVATHKGNHKQIEQDELADTKEEFAPYKDTKLKQMILAETAKQRTEKVKFHGKSYMVSSKSKQKLELFEEFLPRN